MNRSQVWNAEQYDKHARFVSDLGMPVIELLAPKLGERILDVGCGDGVLTAKVAAMGCDVVGIDSSPELVAAAKALGLDARVIDAHHLPFEHEFDAAFSNAALHWMTRPADVIASVRKALKPGGRFVGECGAQGNVAHIQTALLEALKERGIETKSIHPWYFPGIDEYRGLLQKGGFTVRQITQFKRPTPLPEDIMGWLKTFAQPFTLAVPEKGQEKFLNDVQKSLKTKIFDKVANKWVADYVRLRFLAILQ